MQFDSDGKVRVGSLRYKRLTDVRTARSNPVPKAESTRSKTQLGRVAPTLDETVKFSLEAEALKNSHWPKCDELATALGQRGVAATDALKAAATSRTKHVRSAALKALYVANPAEGKLLADRFLTDKAFEVREAAAHILGVPIPP
jgi:hypothetical protein